MNIKTLIQLLLFIILVSTTVTYYYYYKGNKMNYNKVRSSCRVVRVLIGFVLISVGIVQLGTTSGSLLWFLGALPFLAGLINFCPLCIITKKCDLPTK